MAPVGHGKSASIAQILPMWLIARDRETRGLIVSKAEDLAQDSVAVVRKALQNNRELIADYGRFYSPALKWSDSEMFVIRKAKMERNPTIKAAGARGTIEGVRPHWIICDDVVDLKTTISHADTQYTMRWIDEALVPRLEPGGFIIWIGARWAIQDIYGYLMERETEAGRKANILVQPAIGEDGVTVLWPSKWSLEALAEKKAEIGSAAFAGRYLLNPMSIEGDMFKRVWFEYYQDVPELSELRIVGGIDPAVGESIDSDLFAITIVGLHRITGRIYVLDHFAKAKYDVEKQFAKVREMYTKWRPHKLAVEDQQFQWSTYRNLARGLDGGMPVPVVPLRPSKGEGGRLDKMGRINTLAPMVEGKTLIFHPARCAELVLEMLQLPNAEYDDRSDSFEIAVRALGRGKVVAFGEKVGGSL